MPQLITTLGPKNKNALELILPHEHVFVDLRTWDQPGYGQAETPDVIRLMGPELHPRGDGRDHCLGGMQPGRGGPAGGYPQGGIRGN